MLQDGIGCCVLYWSARALMRMFRDALRFGHWFRVFCKVVFGMEPRCVTHTGRTRLRVHRDGDGDSIVSLPYSFNHSLNVRRRARVFSPAVPRLCYSGA